MHESTREQRGERFLTRWRPGDRSGICWYTGDFRLGIQRWNLKANAGEWGAILSMGAECALHGGGER